MAIVKPWAEDDRGEDEAPLVLEEPRRRARSRSSRTEGRSGRARSRGALRGGPRNRPRGKPGAGQKPSENGSHAPADYQKGDAEDSVRALQQVSRERFERGRPQARRLTRRGGPLGSVLRPSNHEEEATCPKRPPAPTPAKDPKPLKGDAEKPSRSLLALAMLSWWGCSWSWARNTPWGAEPLDELTFERLLRKNEVKEITFKGENEALVTLRPGDVKGDGGPRERVLRLTGEKHAQDVMEHVKELALAHEIETDLKPVQHTNQVHPPAPVLGHGHGRHRPRPLLALRAADARPGRPRQRPQLRQEPSPRRLARQDRRAPRRRRRLRRGQGRGARDHRVPEEPEEVLAPRRPDSQGRAPHRLARHRQDAPRESGRGRGRRARSSRSAARTSSRCSSASAPARVRDLFEQGEGELALHHLPRRGRRRREAPRQRHGRRPRRARADPQPDPRRDGRLRHGQGDHRRRGDQPSRHRSTRRSCGRAASTARSRSTSRTSGVASRSCAFTRRT